MMKKLFFTILLFSLFAQGKSQRKPSSIDIKSADEIVFYAKSEMPFSDMGKISEYQGNLVQLNEPSAQFGEADLYWFATESTTVMTKKLCNRYADQIFGSEKDRSLKINDSIQLFETTVGPACDYKLADTYAHAKRPFAYVITGFIHGRLTALVWALSQAPNSEDSAKLRLFWKTLK